MEKTPKVSIIIPVYNGSNYLSGAIDSALNQTYKNIEIIVVNDGSNDGGKTEEIALSYGDKIHYFSKPNGGVSTALNLAIEKMTGKYFSWLSHDDLYAPEKIAVQIAKLNSLGKGKYFIYSDFVFLIVNSNKEVPIKLKQIKPEQIRYYALMLDYPIHFCTLLIPKQAFTECGFFKEELRTTQDYDFLFLKLIKKYTAVHVPEILFKSRRHDEQDGKTLSSTLAKESDNLFFKLLSELTKQEIEEVSNKSVSLFYKDRAYRYWLLGYKKAGNLAAKLALKHGLPKAQLKSRLGLIFDTRKKIYKRKWLDFVYKIAAKMPNRLRKAIKSILVMLHIIN